MPEIWWVFNKLVRRAGPLRSSQLRWYLSGLQVKWGIGSFNCLKNEETEIVPEYPCFQVLSTPFLISLKLPEDFPLCETPKSQADGAGRKPRDPSQLSLLDGLVVGC